MRYFFEDYSFDTDQRELRRGPELIPTAPQVFDLLDYLIRNRDRVVSKDNLVESVWNGRIVSDAAVTTRLNAARTVIGDCGEEQRLIKTLPRKGFRFVGSVREAPGRAAPAGVGSAAGRDAPASASPPHLSIVVLPFANLSGDPAQDYFADGITESLTTDLSRIRGSFVIGRHTAFTYKGKLTKLKQIGQELGVRYVLEGSVQRSGNRLRVNVQLVDAETGAHLWADRFDKTIADLFDMQDEIVSRLANALQAELTEQEARRSERSPHPSSMDLYFQGKTTLYKGWTPEHAVKARGLFEQALALDPDNLEAMIWTAVVDLLVGVAHMSDDKAALVATAEATLMKVLSVAPNHAMAHLYMGTVLMASNRGAQGIAECERALELDRNLAEAHAQIGMGKFYMGRGSEIDAHMDVAFRLSPRDMFAFDWLMMVGFARLQVMADAEAIAWFRRSVEANRNYPLAHFALGAALALLGSQDEAGAATKAGLALDPTFTVRRYRLNPQSDDPFYLARRQRVAEGLRLAGVPEG
ncbi:winged helix-turn-helix domain-containing protein [Bradyrhizobium liaoningense]|uniref:winged helix-turn-helix domain-containing protein n=1 Tax=Bradyrhizobium liaoningense TaxID=43992 RepID=UPI001BA545AD|nr:winged helix-turn-helix domain-containing protein [Bradyrhizobium liaoningense]MBR0715493.1 winged helix-turn-helix domain-containing protein [Bradyrhizobium liaoningense]